MMRCAEHNAPTARSLGLPTTLTNGTQLRCDAAVFLIKTMMLLLVTMCARIAILVSVEMTAQLAIGLGQLERHISLTEQCAGVQTAI